MVSIQNNSMIFVPESQCLPDLFPIEYMLDDLDNSSLLDIDFSSNSSNECDRQCEFSESSVLISETVEVPDKVTSNISNSQKYWLIEDAVSKRSRAPRLYEFLVLMVKNSKYEHLASFIDQRKGTFQIHQPEKVAELWQSVKNRQSNSKMTYDKFARAIRWYYKTNLMKKTNTRYTFQFSSQLLKAYFTDENNNDLFNDDDALFVEDSTNLFEDYFKFSDDS